VPAPNLLIVSAGECGGFAGKRQASSTSPNQPIFDHWSLDVLWILKFEV
jgi:hypothetical protein